MSLEQAMILRARPQVLAGRIRALLVAELSKGCRPDLCDQPVDIEPPYSTFGDEDGGQMSWVPQPAVPEADLLRLAVWISPEQDCEWLRSELFLKQLCGICNRVGLELVGNCRAIGLRLLCHRSDAAVVQTAFLSQFEQCRLSRLVDDPLKTLPHTAWESGAWADFYPPPPYSHRLTDPSELRHSPYATLFAALAQIPTDAMGIYQVLFAPVPWNHNWHANIQAAIDLEYASKLFSPSPNLSRVAQQTPSGDLRQMAMDAEMRAHNDKPILTAALRLAVLGAGAHSPGLLRSLALVTQMVQHGGRPLLHVDDSQYRQVMADSDVRRMFLCGTVHRPGFLLNSWELTTLAHVVPPILNEHRIVGLDLLEPLRPASGQSAGELSEASGTPLGICRSGDLSQAIHLSAAQRRHHVDLIGRPGEGKSTLMEGMILYDIRQGDGMAVLDPHGRLVRRLLDLIPPAHAERVIYLDPGNETYVPLWNPLRLPNGASDATSGGSISSRCERAACNLVAVFRSFVSGWGDRLEHVMRHAFNAVLHLRGGTLLDVAHLLRRDSRESERLRGQVTQLLDNELAIRFWQEDFDRYTKSDLTPAQHKISKLLMSGTAGLMLSQPDSSFDLQEALDKKLVLLWDLSQLGESRDIFGSFVFALLHQLALGRDAADDDLPPFHVYCDEAHRLVTDTLEDVLIEMRKFSMPLTLAHQTMDQMGPRRQQALCEVGTTVIFNVDRIDAQYLQKDLQERVDIKDLLTLERGEAIARIGNQIIRLHTPDPQAPRPDSARDLILSRSHERYCRPAEEIRRRLRGGDAQADDPLLSPQPSQDPEAFAYDEF